MVRRTSDFAIVAVAAVVEFQDGKDAVAAARVALAGVADRVTLVSQELLVGLIGGTGDEASVDAVAGRIAGSVEPPDDVHASGDYRRRLVRVLTADALREACARAAGVAA